LFKPTGFGSVPFNFLGQKPVQTGLAQFFSGFFCLDLVRLGFFGFRLIKPKPNRTGQFFLSFNRFNRFFSRFGFFGYLFFGFLGLIDFFIFLLTPTLLYIYFIIIFNLKIIFIFIFIDIHYYP